ncbi:TPA: accessory Sec system glycosylation chaperone GtfB [Streptococcus agalactiae]
MTVRIYDWFSQETQDLLYSFLTADIDGQDIVLNDDGFLPKGLESPYAYFCDFNYDETEKPLYFNQIQVPAFWQISGNNNQAEVHDYKVKKATIFYQKPGHLRLVKAVDWLGENGKVVLTEHYNKHGWIFAKTYFDTNQSAQAKVYFNQAGQEIIHENYKTGDIILNWEGKVHFFTSRANFILFYLELADFDLSSVWYNTLATSFMISHRLPADTKNDILFWQEEIGDAVPGNMMSILNNPNSRTQKIIVQKKTAYKRLLDLLPEEHASELSYLGYIYPELSEASQSKDILILTNSDQIESLDDLVNALPEYRFHIGALTEMSAKLMAYGNRKNITLYPNISVALVEKLFITCAIYLDINYGNEIISAVRRSFENKLLILAFSETKHGQDFIHSEHIFSKENVADMIALIRDFNQKSQELLDKQKESSGAAKSLDYQNLLEG